MAITIDGWIMLPICISLIAIAGAIYERGQRKGLEAAEELYKPLIAVINSSLEAEKDGEDA